MLAMKPTNEEIEARAQEIHDFALRMLTSSPA